MLQFDVAKISDGWTLFAGEGLFSKAESVSGNTIVLEETLNLSSGNAIAGIQPIAVEVQFEVFSGQPGTMKQYREAQIGFRSKNREQIILHEIRRPSVH